MSNKKEQQPMSTQQAVSTAGIVAAVLGSMWIAKNEDFLKWLIFQKIELIGFIVYAIVLTLIWFLLRKYREWTSAFEERAKLLANIWGLQNGVYVGVTMDGTNICIPDPVRTGHVQVIGATGRGKTESVILPWFIRDLEREYSCVLIDGKGDRELADRIKAYSRHLTRKANLIVFDLGHSDLSAVTNPLKNGSPQQITDRIFAAFDFEDPFYKAVQYEITSFVVQLIVEANEEVTFKRLYEILTNDEKLSELAGKNESLQARIALWLSESKKDRDPKLAGIVSQLGPFALGEVAPLVNGAVSGKECFSLSELLVASEEKRRELIDGGKFAVVILLPALLYQEIAFKLGKMFLQETAWAVAAREEKLFTPIFLDEFSSFVYPGFNSILNKARSSGVALHLSHQSLGDLEQVSRDFAKAVNTNTNVKCLMGLNDPETADFFAKHIGTREEEKITERGRRGWFLSPRERTGDVSIREVEAYKVHPNRLKNFTNGEGVVQFALPEGTFVEEVKFKALPRIAI